MTEIASARLFAADGHKTAPSLPDIRLKSGSRIQSLAVPAATGGAFSLYRWDMAESTTGPSPHYHQTFAESFYILSGHLSFYNGEAWEDLTQGDLVHAPAGALHGFRKPRGQTASILMFFTPGVPRHEYFNELAHRGDSLTEEQSARFHQQHDNHFLAG